jgi:vitamin B12 transporter
VRGNDPLTRLARANNDATIGSLLLRAERRSGAGTLRLTSFASASSRGLPGPIYSPTPASRQDEKSLSSQLAWLSERWDLPVSLRLGTLSTASDDAWTAQGAQAFLDGSVRPALRIPLGAARVVVSGLVGAERFRGSAHGEHGRLRAGLGAGVVKDAGPWTGDVAVRAEWWGGALGLLPRAGGSARLGRGVTLFGNAGGGFRPPSFGELYYAAGPVLPNPDLRPERSWSADLGLRLDRPADDLSVTGSVAAFAGLYDDVIVYELFSGSRAKPFNLGRARTAGIEAETSVRRRSGPLEGLGLAASATLLRATNLVEGPNTLGNDLPYRPRTRASAHLTYERGPVRARAGADWTGEAFANRANTRSIEAFADVNGAVSLALAGDLRLGAELRNALDVTDRACIEGYPLPGRIVLAHLSWEPGPKAP